MGKRLKGNSGVPEKESADALLGAVAMGTVRTPAEATFRSLHLVAGWRRRISPQSKLPRKKMYRARAHSNPLSDHTFDVPENPDAVDWATLYPAFSSRLTAAHRQPHACTTTKPSNEASSNHPQIQPGTGHGHEQECAQGQVQQGLVASGSSGQDGVEPMQVQFADIGCGFGGLLIRLSPLYPTTLMVGMELRAKVSEYVKDRIESLRAEHPGQYTNCSCVRTNAMKYLPHYFRKGQLTKLFFLFPDPHFKVANHRRRIINTTLLTEYAYLLAVGGMLYTITDVPELGDWMRSKLDSHPLFQRISDEELESDPAAGLLTEASEEAQKVARNKGSTHRAVYRRLAAPRVLDANPEKLATRK
ncbi:hypothetical protein QJQ45_001904 [Haematococcus lacustris]|nr:hypothetical protein QJQ45_001904 [Haematococcus lacustris]